MSGVACDPDLRCRNGGALDRSVCKCYCPSGYHGRKCEVRKLNVMSEILPLVGLIITFISQEGWITADNKTYTQQTVNKNLAIANRSRVSCINTNNNTMTLKSGLEVTQGH